MGVKKHLVLPFLKSGNCSGTPETSPNNMLLIAVTVSLSALTVLLLLAVASVFLHKHYRSWSRKHACKLLHRGVNNVVASHSQEVCMLATPVVRVLLHVVGLPILHNYF